jgi:hypothetical protein
MKKQTLLKIQIPRGSHRLYGADFRELLARSANLPEEFFQYKNGKPKGSKLREDGGTPLQSEALPSICTVSGNGWVGILGQPGQEDMVDLATGKAIRLVNSHLGTICKVELENPNFGCAGSSSPITYWIREMVVRRKTPALIKADLATLIEIRVKSGIERYAEAYGFDLPSWEDMDLRIIECEHPRGLAIRTTTGITDEFATLVDVQFKAFIDLQGIWMLGNLTARGYGRVCRKREVSYRKMEVIK